MAQWDLGPLLRALPRHPAKTLLITGDADKAVPPEVSAEAASRMPDARVVSLAGLGHLAHEEDAPATAAPILAFLNAHLD
ncbi:alpha/beta fold hydrolase [Sulfitobacter alexandrii]|uniref:alpha/beta fold hydrolase n=1 Tax=Sulfitobacter alexandrii TaxID=1917485 RepID=UPI001F33B64C|nr:alpha/beta fold hydrolase [Sulfitobacter alexandrii]